MKQKLFNATVVYEKTADEGKIVKATENYILEALTFADAENRIVSEMEYCISGEFNIKNLRRANFAEIVHATSSTSSIFYKVTCSLIGFDEMRQIEKETKYSYLVVAEDVSSAIDAITEHMRGTMSDYRITAIAETKIIDFFPCPAPEADANTEADTEDN